MWKAASNKMVDPDELVHVELSDDERRVLERGLVEWGGPARCTEEMATALGFASVEELLSRGYALADELRAARQIRRIDWLRISLATAVVFACEPIGSGIDWASTTGIPDTETIVLLRALQRKLYKEGTFRGLSLGTRIPKKCVGPVPS